MTGEPGCGSCSHLARDHQMRARRRGLGTPCLVYGCKCERLTPEQPKETPAAPAKKEESSGE